MGKIREIKGYCTW